jgi:serine/threonine-protein kinase
MPRTAERTTDRNASSRAGRSTETLPADLVRGGVRRLGIASLACAGVVAGVFGFMNLAPLSSDYLPIGNAVALACIVLSLAIFALTRAPIAEQHLLNLGLAYEVVGAFGIALAETLATYQPEGKVRGISWVCLWIALFPMVVPSTPGKTLMIAFTSALMGWFALHAAALLGAPLPPVSVMVYLVAPNLAAAGLAVIFSRLIHRLGADVRRAREMGSYTLIEPLGRGGMGEVWRARHRMLAQPAAIKLLTPESLGSTSSDSERLVKRFSREARATAKLTSPNTIRIYDFGRTVDGTLYYVMELLDGIDLETLVEEHGPLPAERVVCFLKQVCDSLAEAHDSGLIHRDIKPANIYACRLGVQHDRIKVLDFGIVALQNADGDHSATRLTADHHIPGTPAYMAPEMVTRNQPIDHRVDIYGLGCVAYWLLTSELVFEGETAVKLLYGHVEKKPVSPSKRTRMKIPAALDALVLDCLRKDPNERPASARALAERLDAVELDEDWNERRAAAWWEGRTLLSQVAGPSRRQRDETIIKA